VLLECAYVHPLVLPEPTPRVLFLKFGQNSLDLELRVWVKKIDSASDIRSDLYFSMTEGLRQNGIQLPGDELDVRIRPMNSDFTTGLNIVESRTAAQQGRSLKNLLRQVSYFQHLTDGQLRQVIESGHRQKLKGGEVLFREHDPGNAFYIVLAGTVEVVSETLNKTLSVLDTGKFFGELSLMLGVPRSATVRALEPTQLFVINQQGFKKLLTEYPQIYDAIVQALEAHQEELAKRQTQLRELGLIDSTEDDKNLMIWVQNRLKRLFKA